MKVLKKTQNKSLGTEEEQESKSGKGPGSLVEVFGWVLQVILGDTSCGMLKRQKSKKRRHIQPEKV